MKYLLLSCFCVVLVQSCEESVAAAQVETHSDLELVINGLSGHLLTLPVSKEKFLQKAQNPSELRDYLLHLCGNSLNSDCILSEATKRTSVFLFEGNTTNPPLEIGAQLALTLVKTAKFIVSDKQLGRLSVEIDRLVVVFVFNRNTLTPRPYYRTGPLTKILFESSFANGLYNVESVNWADAIIDTAYPLIKSLTEVPLTMEFIDFLEENGDYLMQRRSELTSTFTSCITTAFTLLFFKHLGIPAPNDSHRLELFAHELIGFLNTIRLTGDSEIAPDSGVPGIVEWVGARLRV